VPRISVVLPVYNVAGYLPECLESVAAQTVRDLEVIVVDDGSTDASAEIAERFAERDPRFRLIHQGNGGLGSARNTGAAAAGGDFLAFVDSDDVLPRDAYAHLLGALEKTGSDFATGNVRRLLPYGLPGRYLSRAFETTRLKTHVTRFRPLLSDRTAWNKLWRRSFWEAHGLRFPEGVLYEDTPVVVPAHFMARSVDVIAQPVYYWRVRATGDSITQRRLQPKSLLDRLSAVRYVRDYLASDGPPKASRWYEESVVADDLRYFLDVLEAADDDYRRLFLDRVNEFLDTASPRIYRPLPAIHRLKWHLMRHRRMPELLEVLRFEREELAETPPVRIRRRWYGDYPFRADRRVGVPLSVYRLGPELQVSVRIEKLRAEGSRLSVDGWACLTYVGAPERAAQRVDLLVVRPARVGRWNVPVSVKRLKTTLRPRPDLAAAKRRGAWDVTWAGFTATLDASRLRARGRDVDWRVVLIVRAGGVRRHAMALWGARTPRPRAVDLPSRDGARLVAMPVAGRRLQLRARQRWAIARAHRIDGGVLELTGVIGGSGREPLTARLRRGRHAVPLEYPIAVAGDSFTLRVPVADLLAHDDPQADADASRWIVEVAGPGRRHRLALADAAPDGAWPADGRQLAVFRAANGDLALRLRDPRPVLTDARWAADGTLELGGDMAGVSGPQELVLAARGHFERHSWPMTADGLRFAVSARPAAVPSLAGERPLGEDTWELHARPAGTPEERLVPVMSDRALVARLPARTVISHKPFRLEAAGDGAAILVVERDLDDDERGPFHQARLRRDVYSARRADALRDAVVYTSFGGRQYSDSPRAIHAELLRRGAPLEHLWVVDDAAFPAPARAQPLRAGSRAHHEALARARFVVANDPLPRWFEPRADQICLQTWHGTPLKRIGSDSLAAREGLARLERPTAAGWRYVLSPNRFATPILRSALGVEGELLETGLPRNDVLSGPDAGRRGRELRRRLGVPDGVRTILYAPTYRDHVLDRDERLRLDSHLDVAALRAALGGEAVILFRANHRIVDAAPATPDGFVRDVSRYPDCTELLLAADVLVSDYSSVIVDFANTGRPIVLFAYDLEAFREEIRGLYVDLAAIAPGPVVRGAEELAGVLRDPSAAQDKTRYSEFAETFCELDDGGATARVVDRVFGGWTPRRQSSRSDRTQTL
jgi:CDP-glycerol glycerophosphotransferase